MNGVDHGSLTGRGQLRLRMLFQFSKNGAQTFRESVGIGGVGLRPSGRANIGSLNFGAFRFPIVAPRAWAAISAFTLWPY